MRLMIVCSTTGYQTRAYAEAAAAMGLETVFASDRCHVLDDPWRDGALALRFEDPAAPLHIINYARQHPLDGIVPLGDRTVPVAARACAALGLPSHPPEAAEICRDKFQSRGRLKASGLNIPRFDRYSLDADPRAIGRTQEFPCVLKPLSLSGSRGVIRANDAEDFARAFQRIRRLLRSADVGVLRDPATDYLQVESYVEGDEVAVEGFVEHGAAQVTAIFDKPDPLTGPFFEETIYVTPSRLPPISQQQILAATDQAVKALGLFHGPFHAEMRVNGAGAWPIEVAARGIGGICANALRFSSMPLGGETSLEKLVIALALGLEAQPISREDAASGVMMMPIKKGGVLREVMGLDEARATEGVEEIIITSKPSSRLVPFPEGCSYPGFIFARGPSPEFVEAALRLAFSKLRFDVTPELPVFSEAAVYEGQEIYP